MGDVLHRIWPKDVGILFEWFLSTKKVLCKGPN
jgi:hypothetical protein